MDAEQLIWLHPEIIVQHSLYPKFGCSLAEISDRDYPNKNYITQSIEAIDLDSYETFLSDRDNDCTADAVLGICNERQGLLCNKRHLLVELRMNYSNVNNLRASNIKQKDVHSRDLLNACNDCKPIDPSFCLLFDQSVLSQAERWIYRIRSEHKYAISWYVFSPETFCNHINADKQIPYTPKQETINVGNNFSEIAKTYNLENLDKECQYIKQYISKCRQRYEKGECSFLCQCIIDNLHILKSWKFDDEDVALYYEIIIEDLDKFLHNTLTWINS